MSNHCVRLLSMFSYLCYVWASSTHMTSCGFGCIACVHGYTYMCLYMCVCIPTLYDATNAQAPARPSCTWSSILWVWVYSARVGIQACMVVTQCACHYIPALYEATKWASTSASSTHMAASCGCGCIACAASPISTVRPFVQVFMRTTCGDRMKTSCSRSSMPSMMRGIYK